MSMEIAYLKTQADEALACARRLAEKAQADGRHLSYSEQTAFDRKMADARRFAEQIKQHRREQGDGGRGSRASSGRADGQADSAVATFDLARAAGHGMNS
jgi:hypothetical protein